MRWQRKHVDLPLNAIDGNLIFARDRAAGVYRLATRNLAFASRAERQKAHEQLALWMMRTEADFSLYRVCREYPADAYVADTVSLIDERYADRARWEALLERQANHMRSMRSFTPEVYATVSLTAPSRVPWSRQARDLSLLRDADESALDQMKGLGARRAYTSELQWLMCRAPVRGVCEPDLDPYWAPPALSLDGGVWEPGRADVQSLMPVVTERSHRGRGYVHVAGEDGESIQAMLVLGKLPWTREYPGNAELLLGPLESLNFPVDAVVHVHWLSNKKMLGICDDSTKDAHDEFEDASFRNLDRKTKRRVAQVADAQDYFSSDPYPPGLESLIFFAVGAPADDPDLLEERVKRLRRAYGQIRLQRPFALQADLFAEHFLRPDGARSQEYRRDYRRLLIAEQLAAMMPIGASEGGAKRGIYVGYTIPGAKRPVKDNPLEASQTNRAGATLFCGTLGGGKTFAAEWNTYLAEHRGSIVVDVDPRPDHSFEALLGAERVHSISLDNDDQNRGRLDPLAVALPAMREELAVTYLFDLLEHDVPEWKTEIMAAVRYVLRQPNPSSFRVLEVLLSGGAPDDDRSDDSERAARAAGRALKQWSDWGLCRLAFGDGSTSQTDLAKPLTTIKVDGLSLPDAGVARDAYNQSERISVGTFKLIVAYAMRLLSLDRSAHKVLLLDEVHAFADTSDGRRFLQRVLRMARSMNVSVFMITQLIGDLEKLKDLIGVVYCFRQENADQARASLRLLGLDEDDKRLVDMLCNFTDGMCLHRGLDKRVVPIQVDSRSEPHFHRLADTNPTRLLERQEAAP